MKRSEVFGFRTSIISLFYVYLLMRPDGTPFYVGMGKNQRFNDHDQEARSKCLCVKCELIRSIWADGQQVEKLIVFTTKDRKEALEVETRTIHKYRDQLVNIKSVSTQIEPEPPLCASPTQREIDLRRQDIAAKLSDLRSSLRYAHLQRDTETRDRLKREIKALRNEFWKPRQANMFDETREG